MANPKLGGGLTPQEWLRSMAASDRKVQANARAEEAEAIADWLDEVFEGGTDVDIDETDSLLAILLERTRDVRTKTADIRLGQVRVRYPEIPAVVAVKPLSDTEIIIKALEREALAQETILRDLQK